MGKYTVLLAFERAGTAISLLNQHNGYLQLAYRPVGARAQCLGMFEGADINDAVAEYHNQVGINMLGQPNEAA